MAHCPPELLDDVAGLIAEVLAWPGVVEKSPGVLYARRQPFLHFHLTRGRRRRADVKGRAGWTSLELPRPIPATKRQAFRRLLRARYRETEAGSLD
jgi:hypothetical protein